MNKLKKVHKKNKVVGHLRSLIVIQHPVKERQCGNLHAKFPIAKQLKEVTVIEKDTRLCQLVRRNFP